MEVGGWVKLANKETIINGFIRNVTDTYVHIHGLYPLPLKDWDVIIIKPAPGKTTSIRKTNHGTDG